jgi:NAD(P)-dependent dehydrogenase (short-subunit alcohol dehydrogenase family)
MSSIQTKVWLITGCSRGLGQALATAVLAAGDHLVATARDAAALAPLVAAAPERVLALALDVNEEGDVADAIGQTLARFGRIDVLVNNAGYGLAGAVEEISDAEARAQFETNLFGTLNLIRAVLPAMRAQRGGHILQISSVAGFVASPGLGLYNASKFALEGYSEALAQEVAPFGIRVTIIEPGPFRTDWAGSSLATPTRPIADYADSAHKTISTINGYSGKQPGDPQRAAAAMIAIVNTEHPPLRLALGELALNRMRGKLASVAAELNTWESTTLATAYPS